MNRKQRRAAKFKAPRPNLRQLATSLCLAAPWCVRSRWPAHYDSSVEMSFAGREVFRRHQYAADMAASVLVIGNGTTTLCVGDSRAGYDLLVRRGGFKHFPPFEEWTTKVGGNASGVHAVLKARDGDARAFVDLTFGQVTIKTKGAIQVPPAFAGFGSVEWPSAQMEGVWFAYTDAPEPAAMRTITSKEWSGLIDDLAVLVEIALGCGNDGRVFDAEMERQVRRQNR
jgi:hypothetical protein